MLTGLAAAFGINVRFGVVAAAYVTLQALYSGPLKHLVIIDVLTIAAGFVLRAVAGAEVVNVDISHWLLVCTILLALFIALAKRRHELTLLADGATSHRPILSEQPVSPRSNDFRRHGFDTDCLCLLYDQPGDAAEVWDSVAGIDDPVSVVRNFPLSLSRSSA